MSSTSAAKSPVDPTATSSRHNSIGSFVNNAALWNTRYCCFGCTVKEATMVIAIVIIVVRIINLVFACLGYFQLPYIDDEISPSGKTQWLPIILMINIVDALLEILGCVLLIKAIQNGNRYLLVPWLVYNSICILYNVIGAIHFFVVSLYVGFAGVVGSFLVVFLSLRIYFFLIVALYYKLLLEGVVYVTPYPPARLGDVEFNANKVTVNVSIPSGSHEDGDIFNRNGTGLPVIVTL